MAFSPQSKEFVNRWLGKADEIKLSGQDFATYFDKFITLFVAYNRLYADATFALWRKDPKLLNPDGYFPDKKGATKYVAAFLGHHEMIGALESNADTRAAINKMRDIIDGGMFNIQLYGPESVGNRANDEQLLQQLNSKNETTRGEAVLTFLYSVRCNTFHGSKSYEPMQVEVLAPCIVVVAHLIGLLLAKLVHA